MNLFLANSVFYYKELTDGAMNDKFQDLQSASWRPRRADGITSSSSLSPKLGEKQCPSSKAERKSKFFLTLSLVLFGPSVGWMGLLMREESQFYPVH